MEALYPPELYEATHRGNAGDLRFYTQLAKSARRLLELGSGYGRVLSALSEQTQAELVGLEIHPGLLARARARLPEAVSLHLGDMQGFSLGSDFDLVILPYSGILCLLEDSAVDRMLASVKAALLPGGRFACDLYIPPKLWRGVTEVEDPTWRQSLGEITAGSRRYRLLEESDWAPERQMMDVRYLYEPVLGGAIRRGRIRQRYLFPDQVRAALARNGFSQVKTEVKARVLFVTARL